MSQKEELSGMDTWTVLDGAGEVVRLADAWRERTAVIVFLRHFG